MFVREAPELTDCDVTPKSVYFDRRKFLRGMGLAGVAAVGGKSLLGLVSPSITAHATTKLADLVKSQFTTDEKQTPYNDVTHYNNFYEFGSNKGDPAKNSQNFRTSPWSVSVEGEVSKPRKFTIEQIHHRGNSEAGAARGAHLPPSVRRSMVDRRTLDRLLLQCSREACRAYPKSTIRRL